tara:strand:- start:114 stop:566 length:453 start_codon:yes stop_codon:yes gene_type:complete
MKFLIPIILLLAACSQPAPVARIAQTPSGYPEAVFSGISAQKLADKLAADCMEHGELVVIHNEKKVKCESPMTEENKNWAKAYIGNPYADNIHHFLEYNLVETSGKIRVQAREWTQLQMPYGQIKKREFKEAKDTNGLQKFLYKMGGKPV